MKCTARSSRPARRRSGRARRRPGRGSRRHRRRGLRRRRLRPRAGSSWRRALPRRPRRGGARCIAPAAIDRRASPAPCRAGGSIPCGPGGLPGRRDGQCGRAGTSGRADHGFPHSRLDMHTTFQCRLWAGSRNSDTSKLDIHRSPGSGDGRATWRPRARFTSFAGKSAPAAMVSGMPPEKRGLISNTLGEPSTIRHWMFTGPANLNGVGRGRIGIHRAAESQAGGTGRRRPTAVPR